MKCVICGQPIEEGRRQGQPPLLAKYCIKCRAERRRRSRVKYAWLPEYDAYLKAPRLKQGPASDGQSPVR